MFTFAFRLLSSLSFSRRCFAINRCPLCRRTFPFRGCLSLATIHWRLFTLGWFATLSRRCSFSFRSFCRCFAFSRCLFFTFRWRRRLPFCRGCLPFCRCLSSFGCWSTFLAFRYRLALWGCSCSFCIKNRRFCSRLHKKYVCNNHTSFRGCNGFFA